MTFFAKKIIDLHRKVKNETFPVQPDNLSETKYLKKIHEYLKKIMLKPPQSGSSTLFWKNLYLTFPRK